MSSNLKVNTILPSTGTTVAVSGIVSATSSVSIGSSCTATTFYGSGANLTSLPAQATIANNADNRVITGGSGVNLNGESGLTFDGTTLTVAGASNATQAIFSGTGGSGSRGLEIKTESGGAVDEVVVIKTRASGTTGAIKFQTNGANSLELAGNGGDVTVKQGNLKFGIGGKGIDFSSTGDASGMTSELLDDYEEGSFTPYIDREHNTPIIGYDAQDGYYTKIGRVVYFYAEVRINSYNGNGSYGNTFLRGLPYQSAARTGGRGVWNSVQYNSYYRDIDSSASNRDIAVVQPSSEKVVFYVMRNESSWTAPPAPDANDQFKIGGFYFT